MRRSLLNSLLKKPHLLRCSVVRLCGAIPIAPPRSLPRALRSKAFKAAAKCRNERHCGHLRLFQQTVKRLHRRAGFTAVELIITIVLAATLASAFVSLAVPQIDLLFDAPYRLRMQKDAFDLMEVIFEGDNAAPGLRYAGPLAGAGLSILEATPLKIKYTFTDTNGESHTVTLTYDPVTRRIMRRVQTLVMETVLPEDADAEVSPTETNSDGNDAIFRYYDSTPTEFVPTPFTLGQIARVDVTIKVSPAPGIPAPADTAVVLKSGVEIKHLIQVGSAC